MTKTIRLKVTVTCVVEYDANPEHYPGCKTAQEMLDVDIDVAKEDVCLFLDSSDAIWSYSGEVL